MYELLCNPSRRERYRRRLCRSQVYCAIATLSSIYLLSGCSWSAHDLLYDFSAAHQIFFSMAVGHWLVAIWEDVRNITFLSAGAGAHDVKGVVEPNIFLARAYLVHHGIAAAGFAGVMYFRTCTGIGCFGLVFELPVLMMNHREFAVFADTPPSWFHNQRDVDAFWHRLGLLFKVGRFGPSAVYVYSLIFWWDDLDKLSYQELYLYHGMAIFFTLLNWIFTCSFLATWETKDHEVAAAAEAGEEEVMHSVVRDDVDLNTFLKDAKDDIEKAEAQDEGEEDGDLQEPEVTLEPRKALGTYDENFLAKEKGPDNKEGEVWFEIDSILYNVTDFLDTHPGGEHVLRRYAGCDATQAFKKVRHSMNAKIMMQKYAAGPVRRKEKAYRIFEHNAELSGAWWSGFFPALAYMAAGLLVPRSAWGGLTGMATGADIALDDLLVPGLFMAAGGGGAVGCAIMLKGNLLNYSAKELRGAARMGLWIFLHWIGFMLARRPLGPGASSARPGGLELSAAALFLIEEVVEFTQGCRYWSWSVLVGLGIMLVSWHFRGLTLSLLPGPGAPGISGLAALMLAVSVSLMTRRAAKAGKKAAHEAVVAEILMGYAFAGFYASVLLLYFHFTGPIVMDSVLTLWFQPFLMWGLAASAGSLVIVAMLLTFNNAFGYNPAWSSRCTAIYFGIAAGISGGLSSWRWLSWAAWFWHCGHMAARSRQWHEAATAEGTFAQLPVHSIGTRAMWDTLRAALTALSWRAVVHPMGAFLNSLLPEELLLYGCGLPIFQLGEDVDLGVAAYFAPKAGRNAQTVPEHFVCNVGHVALGHPSGIQDLQITMNTLRDVWSEFKKPNVKGLLANMVCVFPKVAGTKFAKEINMSCWQTAADAHRWYATSEGHANIMRRHGGGGLRTFGNLLASLKPHGKIRHQDRCASCARLVESDEVGEKAPERCRACGKKSFNYPFF